METKFCKHCQQIKAVTEFRAKKDTKDGLRYWCKECDKEYQRQYTKAGYFREYQRKPEYRQKKAERMQAYRQRPDVKIKNMARWYVHHELRAGRIIQEPCALCGKEQSQVHHPDYSQPLLIVWLCGNCHYELHLKKLAEGK